MDISANIEEPIIILLCGCQKYINSVKNAIIRWTNPNWKVIALIGDPTLDISRYNINDNILYLNVNDSYEYLPSKIYAGIEWCYKQWPNLKGIFKTDDDIMFENYNKMVTCILENTHIPYWGLHVDSISGGLVHQTTIERCFNDKSLKDIQYYKTTHCFGAGYWLSNDVIKHITQYKSFFDNIGLEDTNIGYIINKGGWIPKHIPNPWWQLQR